MRISDWSSDVCSSDLLRAFREGDDRLNARFDDRVLEMQIVDRIGRDVEFGEDEEVCIFTGGLVCEIFGEFHVCMRAADGSNRRTGARSEEHTSELQSLMRSSYAVCCLKKKIKPLISNNMKSLEFNKHLTL